MSNCHVTFLTLINHEWTRMRCRNITRSANLFIKRRTIRSAKLKLLFYKEKSIVMMKKRYLAFDISQKRD